MFSSAGLASAQPPVPVLKWPPIAPAQAKLEQTFRGLDGAGLAIAANENAMTVAAACAQHTIHLWHKDTLVGLRDGSNSVNVLNGHTGSVLALTWGDGPLISAGSDKKICLWDVMEGKLLQSMDCSFMPRALSLARNSKTLAVVGDSAVIQFFDIAQAKPAGELKGHSDWVQCAQFSEDGKQLISGGYGEHALLWDVANAKQIRELPAPPKEKPKTPPEPNPITSVVFSPDGKQALLGRADGTIEQVNLTDGQKIRTMTGHTSAVTGLLFHPSGTLAVSCSKDGSIRLWNPANGTLIKTLTDHTAWVEGITLINQGTRLASVGADQTVRVWSLTG
jgi:WD40 repeat protein